MNNTPVKLQVCPNCGNSPSDHATPRVSDVCPLLPEEAAIAIAVICAIVWTRATL